MWNFKFHTLRLMQLQFVLQLLSDHSSPYSNVVGTGPYWRGQLKFMIWKNVTGCTYHRTDCLLIVTLYRRGKSNPWLKKNVKGFIQTRLSSNNGFITIKDKTLVMSTNNTSLEKMYCKNIFILIPKNPNQMNVWTNVEPSMWNL